MQEAYALAATVPLLTSVIKVFVRTSSFENLALEGIGSLHTFFYLKKDKCLNDKS
jgi:hypothetical protein